MTNSARGEVAVNIGGRAYILCLTLGALSEITSSLGVEDFSKIDEAFAKDPGRSINVALVALARGGGMSDIADDHFLGVSAGELQACSQAIGAAFSAANMGGASLGKPMPTLEKKA